MYMIEKKSYLCNCKKNTITMDRRTFIKNAAMAAASTTVAAPVAAMLANESRTQILEEHPLAAQEKEEERKLKVLMVNGSPRPDGNTFCALKEMEGQLVNLGLDVEIIQRGSVWCELPGIKFFPLSELPAISRREATFISS